MKRIYDWDAKFQLRNYTIADLLNCKGRKILTQTTANSMEEAAAAKDAELDRVYQEPQINSNLTLEPQIFEIMVPRRRLELPRP